MSKGKLFEYAVIYHPKSTKDTAGNDVTEVSKLVVDVTRVVAADDKTVGMMAVRRIPEEFTDKLDLLEVVVRPF